MQKLLKRISLSVFAAAVLAFAVSVLPASAQSDGGNGNGLRISPVRTDLVIEPGGTKVVTLTVQNTTSADAEFRAITNDFIAGDSEFGEPSLILNDDEYAPSHSLKRYIAPIPNIEINAGQSKDVKVTITMPRDVAAGGYYGAVRFAPVNGSNGPSNISLTASVGSLMLVKVPGDIKESLTLESFDVRTGERSNNASSLFFSNKDLYAVARFKNNGNVHEQPFGKVVLKRGNTILQTTELNNTDLKGNVLPDSIRRFSVKLDKVGMWGKYTVEGNFGYGTSGQLVSGKSTFYVIPLMLILGVLALIALVVAAILWLPKAIKRYNERVVRKANRRK